MFGVCTLKKDGKKLLCVGCVLFTAFPLTVIFTMATTEQASSVQGKSREHLFLQYAQCNLKLI